MNEPLQGRDEQAGRNLGDCEEGSHLVSRA